MEQLAFYDTLTGLPNRQLFREQLEQAVKMVERTGREIAVLYLDLDHFKRVNDTLGHDAGDILLQRMGERLSRCVRREDTVARLSGDEFTVLLAEVEGPGGASRVAHKILHALADPIRIAGQEVFVSASIGLTLCPRDGVDASALMKNADLAMYQAKERGRDNYQFYTRELNEQASERLHKESALRRALIEGHMVLHYQPLVEQASGEICSVEALLRWTPPQAEMVMPDQFIGVAEETGLIVPIGRWVLETACRQIQALHDQGASELSVAVNLSTRQFHDPDLVSTVEMALAQTGLAPAWLQLEITESMLMERVEQAIETLWRLKNLGVSLSIDDFGVGYSSLSYLKRLPVDTIKVDRDFVRDIPRDTNDTEITAAVIAMAHKLKLSVVAEGVETEAQVQFLRNNQCDYLQGFLFGAPQPLDLLRERLVAGGRMPSPPTPLPLSAVSRPT
jgi:diguanylate cyclase (GGDEF)-like protein